MEISGHPQGVFSISEPGTVGKTPIPCIMGISQRQAGVEVLDISLEAKSARIQVNDNISLITLEEPKGSTGGPGTMAAGPGQGMMGGGRQGYPPTRPGFGGSPSAANNFNNSIPGATANPGYDPGNANTAAMGGADAGDPGTIPNRPVRTDPEIPVEQQMANMEAQRQQALDAGRMILPP